MTERVKKAVLAYKRVSHYINLLDQAKIGLDMATQKLSPEEVNDYAKATSPRQLPKNEEQNQEQA